MPDTKEFKLDDLIFGNKSESKPRESITQMLRENLKLRGFRVFLGPFAVKYLRNDMEEVLKRKGLYYEPSSEKEYMAYLDELRSQADFMNQKYQGQKN